MILKAYCKVLEGARIASQSTCQFTKSEGDTDIEHAVKQAYYNCVFGTGVCVTHWCMFKERRVKYRQNSTHSNV